MIIGFSLLFYIKKQNSTLRHGLPVGIDILGYLMSWLNQVLTGGQPMVSWEAHHQLVAIIAKIHFSDRLVVRLW